MPSKIIFDASVLVSGSSVGNLYKTGLYRVSYELLKELTKSEEFELYLFDVFHRERELIKYVQKEFPRCYRIRIYSSWYSFLIFPLGNWADTLRDVQKSNKNRRISILSAVLKNVLLIIEKAARKIERQFFIEKNLKKSFNQCELYFSTYFPLPYQILSNPKIKKVFTVHDMIPIMHPEYFSSPYNQILVKEVVDLIGESDYVVTFSESTKKDILAYRQDIPQGHILVSPLAASDNFQQDLNEEKGISIRVKYNIPSGTRYLLSVCTLEPRKNLKILLAAYKELLNSDKIESYSLVLTGSDGWGNDILLQEIREINSIFNNSIILTGFVPDNELVILYSNAYAFIYPSLYEGFGLPPLEAMQCGIPVIASNTSSLPEVVGDVGLLIDPLSKKELIKAIELLYNNSSLRNKLAQDSLKRAELFNWSLTANRIIEVIKTAK